MAKRLVWTSKAEREMTNIISYWNDRNNSKTYSSKLFSEIKLFLRLLRKRNFIGRKTQNDNVRIIVFKVYLIIYKIEKDAILILSIVDGRRSPDEIKIN